MAQDIFIGVDGGGSKSKIRIEDANGVPMGQAVCGPANIRLSVSDAWQSIYQGISEVLSHTAIQLTDPHYRFHLGLGLAGCELAEARKQFLAKPHSFTTLKLESDAYTACLGAHAGDDGAIIIVGTGVVGYQIEKGKTSKSGGWGFPIDDEGGGAWIGMEAVRLTLHWLDHRAEKSPLATDVFDFFNQSVDQMMAWVNDANSTEFARLAPIVINHAQQEEIAAVRIIKRAAHAIDRIAFALTKMRDDTEKKFSYCLFGGIAPFLESWLHEDLREQLTQRKAGASEGAILMIQDCVKEQEQVCV